MSFKRKTDEPPEGWEWEDTTVDLVDVARDTGGVMVEACAEEAIAEIPIRIEDEHHDVYVGSLN